MKLTACAAAFITLVLVACGPAAAQQRQLYPGATDIGRFPAPAPGVTALERPRPEFAARGIDVDGVRIVPSIAIAEYYDSNIFAVDDEELAAGADEEDDFVTFIAPQVAIESRHDALRLSGFLGAGFSRFLDNSDQDVEEVEALARGRYLLSPDDAVDGTLTFRRDAVSRQDVEEGGGTGDPRLVHRVIGRAGYSGERGPLVLDFDVQAADHNFLLGIQRDKDRRVYDGTFRVGYRASRELIPFVEPFFEVRDFDTAVDDNGFARDAERIGARLGTAYLLGEVLSLEAAVGAARWSFDESGFGSEDVWIVEGQAGWNLTPLTTLKAGVGRDEVHTTRANASLKEVITANVGVEHVFRPDILTFADAEYRMVDFNRSATREDDNLRFAVGGEYLLGRTFSVSAQYVYSQRDSNIAGEDFTRNVIWFAVRAQY